jgi:N-acetylmuramoyl-L-alanine amidase
MSWFDGITAAPSPNFDIRALPVCMIVLHYTGMASGAAALQRLRDPQAKVSAHYLVEEDGRVFALVPEDRRAWHAGVSSWRGMTDVNSASVGIEIVNPGHEFGYRAFPRVQMARVVRLVQAIAARHRIDRADIVGHSDVAPARKDDPGELFDWGLLARHRLALARPQTLLIDPLWADAATTLSLERFGYDVADPVAAVRAFQRRFRPECFDGMADGETRAILFTLLAQEAARKGGVA